MVSFQKDFGEARLLTCIDLHREIIHKGGWADRDGSILTVHFASMPIGPARWSLIKDGFTHYEEAREDRRVLLTREERKAQKRAARV